MANTGRMNLLEEVGRIDAEKPNKNIEYENIGYDNTKRTQKHRIRKHGKRKH